ncbi:MAG: divalent-cation tolerance protein CutA [Saprospiraceae bacterium]
MNLLMLYIPCPTEDVAENILGSLLESKIIACGNVIQSKSMYWWNGDISREDEWIAIVKSLPDLYKVIEIHVKSIHPYDIPAILRWEVDANQEYVDWVNDQVVVV